MDQLRKPMSYRLMWLSILVVACAGRMLPRHAGGASAHVPNHSVSQ